MLNPRARSEKPADPGSLPRVSRGNRQPRARKLEATRRRRRESPMREENLPMDVKPTLSQAWTVDEPRSAICVQSVDVHVSCSSHSDAQLAAFFIDPRAK